MSVATSTQPTPQQRADQLLLERNVLVHFVDTLDRLEAAVRELESRYGMASSEVSAAIEAGTLDETVEVSTWLLDYELLQRARAVFS